MHCVAWLKLTPLLFVVASQMTASAAVYTRDGAAKPYPGAVDRIEVRTHTLDDGRECVELKLHSGEHQFGFIVVGRNALGLLSGDFPSDLDRYVLQTGRGEYLEFQRQGTGTAFLPYSFSLQPELVIPQCLDEEGRFRDSTTFLGESFILSPGAEASAPVEIPQTKVIRLCDDVLVGTSRNFRDTGAGRIPVPRSRSEASQASDYVYRTLDENDLARMVAAGFNYFDRVLPEQLDDLYDQPVFFDVARFVTSPAPMFPELLFHPGFQGVEDFIDEPAWRFWSGAGSPRLAESIEEMARLQERETSDVYNRKTEGRPPGLMQKLAADGIVLDGIELTEPAVPIWEEFYDTACYQLHIPVSGFVHEGRYKHPETVDLLNRTFRVSLPRDPKTVFLFYDAFLRGGARVFDKDWGVSIYGQADPEISLLGLEMAYDRGARFFWFWSSDRDHHLPFEEQLALARDFTKYVSHHPRGDRRKLTRAARDAVVLPYGFTFSVSDWDKSQMADLWHRSTFPIRDGRTEAGVTYYSVLRCAAMKIEQLIESGREFDIVIDVLRLESAGYERLHRVLADAREAGYRYPWWIDYKSHIAIATLIAFLLVYRAYRVVKGRRRRKEQGQAAAPTS